MLHHVRGCSLRRWAEWRVDPSHELGGKLDPSPVSPWQVVLEKQGPQDHGVGMLQAPAVEDDAVSREMKLFRAARAGPGIPVTPRQSCADRLCPLLQSPKSAGSGGCHTGLTLWSIPALLCLCILMEPPSRAPCATPMPHATGEFCRHNAVLLQYTGSATRCLLAASPLSSPFYYYYFKAPQSQAFLQNAEEKRPNSSSAGNAAPRK